MKMMYDLRIAPSALVGGTTMTEFILKFILAQIQLCVGITWRSHQVMNSSSQALASHPPPSIGIIHFNCIMVGSYRAIRSTYTHGLIEAVTQRRMSIGYFEMTKYSYFFTCILIVGISCIQTSLCSKHIVFLSNLELHKTFMALNSSEVLQIL